jgi:DNA-binding transcriptional ArsR family regulator
MRKRNKEVVNKFPGFKTHYVKEFFMYPNILEQYWYQLSGSEQKVLDFILRQTIGFRKMNDKIALSQFTDGIGEKNKGTGLSLSQVQRALKRLEEMGFIEGWRRKNRPTIFTLVFEKDDTFKIDSKAFSAFIKNLTPNE